MQYVYSTVSPLTTKTISPTQRRPLLNISQNILQTPEIYWTNIFKISENIMDAIFALPNSLSNAPRPCLCYTESLTDSCRLLGCDVQTSRLVFWKKAITSSPFLCSSAERNIGEVKMVDTVDRAAVAVDKVWLRQELLVKLCSPRGRSQVKRKENPVERNKLASLEATCIS